MVYQYRAINYVTRWPPNYSTPMLTWSVSRASLVIQELKPLSAIASSLILKPGVTISRLWTLLWKELLHNARGQDMWSETATEKANCSDEHFEAHSHNWLFSTLFWRKNLTFRQKMVVLL